MSERTDGEQAKKRGGGVSGKVGSSSNKRARREQEDQVPTAAAEVLQSILAAPVATKRNDDDNDETIMIPKHLLASLLQRNQELENVVAKFQKQNDDDRVRTAVPAAVLGNVLDYISHRKTWNIVARGLNQETTELFSERTASSWPQLNLKGAHGRPNDRVNYRFSKNSQWLLGTTRDPDQACMKFHLWNKQSGKVQTSWLDCAHLSEFSSDRRYMATYDGCRGWIQITDLGKPEDPVFSKKNQIDVCIGLGEEDEEDVEYDVIKLSFSPDGKYLAAYHFLEWLVPRGRLGRFGLSLWRHNAPRNQRLRRFDFGRYFEDIAIFHCDNDFILFQTYKPEEEPSGKGGASVLVIWYHDDPEIIELGYLRTTTGQQNYGAHCDPVIIASQIAYPFYTFEGRHLRIHALSKHPGRQHTFAFLSRPKKDRFNTAAALDNTHSAFIGVFELYVFDPAESPLLDSAVVKGCTKIRSIPYRLQGGHLDGESTVSSQLHWFSDGIHLAYAERWYIQVLRVDIEDGTLKKPSLKSTQALLQRKVNTYMSFQSSKVYIAGFEIAPDGRTIILSLCEDNEWLVDDGHFKSKEEKDVEDEGRIDYVYAKKAMHKKSFHKVISL